MTLVARPFVLDFANAYLDDPPQFSDEIWEPWAVERAEHFGANWPMALRLRGKFEAWGIPLMDVTPKGASQFLGGSKMEGATEMVSASPSLGAPDVIHAELSPKAPPVGRGACRAAP